MRTARAIIAGLALVAFMGLAPSSRAQTITTLVPFNATWKYDQSGTDLGTAWRAPTFNDAAWPSGTGLLEGGEGTAYPVPFGTVIAAPGATRITDYFRTSFFFSGTTNGITLYATNFVDDSCVIYLNGTEAGRIRVPTGQNYLTLGTAQAAEGQVDLITINPALLRPNQQNYLAVEVHQNAAGSSDVVWGMRLVTYQQSALTITTQPQSTNVSVGDTVNFSVVVAGGPAFYQWQKDQVNIPTATNATYTIQPAGLTSAGTYRVIVTNNLSRLTSSNAVLTVFADTDGPVMESAILGDIGTATNQIDVLFNEQLLPTTATTNNIRLVRSGSAGPNSIYATVSNVLVSGRTVRLRSIGGPNWDSRSNYYVIANSVADARGNLIAPNSVIPVSARVRTNVIQMSAYWDYYALHVFNSVDGDAIYTDNKWYLPSYVPSNGVEQLWGRTFGILFQDLNATAVLCAGDSLNNDQTISFQRQPTLFRTTFNFGTNFGTVGPLSGTLGLRYMVDDGFILYLNGVQIFSNNVPGGQLTAASRAPTGIDNPTCTTNFEVSVNNLMPGTNWLAAAVLNNDGSSSDIYFGLELDGIFPRPGTVPTNGLPSLLKLTPTRLAGTPNRVQLTWPNTSPNIYYGFILEESSALATPSINTTWLTVSNQSNGVIIPASQSPRFYRLIKGPNSGK